MKKFLFAGIAAAAFVSAPALAADYPVKAPMAPVFNWTGFYVGGNIADMGFKSSRPVVGDNNPQSGMGFAGGGQVGVNWQAAGSPLVFGVESSGDWAHIRSQNSCANAAFTCSLGMNQQYDVRARVGLAMNNFMIYGTVGEAWTTARGFTDNGAHFPANSKRTGVVWGGGVEGSIAHTNWILGLEALYTDFGTKNMTYDAVYTVPFATWEARARLSYLFSWGGR